MIEIDKDIDKLYKNAETTLIETKDGWTYTAHPFSPEKQIRLLQFIFSHTHCFKYFNLIFSADFCFRSNDIAKIINANWQDLTDEEQKQIRNILNENHKSADS